VGPPGPLELALSSTGVENFIRVVASCSTGRSPQDVLRSPGVGLGVLHRKGGCPWSATTTRQGCTPKFSVV
jgi:hypothetical protein